MKHDAIVPATQPAIPGLDSIARVGLTFRYFRRSFLEIRRRAPAAAAAAGQRPLAGPSRTSPSPDRLAWQPQPLDLDPGVWGASGSGTCRPNSGVR